jgi:hypothetical protein
MVVALGALGIYISDTTGYTDGTGPRPTLGLCIFKHVHGTLTKSYS